MNYTYSELKAMFETSKIELYKKIVATLVQADHPMTAREIANATGCSDRTVTNLLAKHLHRYDHTKEYVYEWSSVGEFARPLDLRIYAQKKDFPTTYINPLDPSDILTIHKECYVYWVEPIDPEDCI